MTLDICINDKVILAFNLSCDVHDKLTAGTLAEPDTETLDMVYGHADGLIAKHAMNMRNGRCSLAASIAFDPAEFEVGLDNNIAAMRELLR